MSETKRPTPGPWHVTYGLEIVTEHGSVIADVGVGVASSIANAHLIAAAPDLFNALAAIIEGPTDEYSGGRYAAAHTAISKARGESPDRGNRARGT